MVKKNEYHFRKDVLPKMRMRRTATTVKNVAIIFSKGEKFCLKED